MQWVSVFTVQSTGWSALFFAAERGDLYTVKLLIKAGANPHLADKVSSVFTQGLSLPATDWVCNYHFVLTPCLSHPHSVTICFTFSFLPCLWARIIVLYQIDWMSCGALHWNPSMYGSSQPHSSILWCAHTLIKLSPPPPLSLSLSLSLSLQDGLTAGTVAVVSGHDEVSQYLSRLTGDTPESLTTRITQVCQREREPIIQWCVACVFIVLSPTSCPGCEGGSKEHWTVGKAGLPSSGDQSSETWQGEDGAGGRGQRSGERGGSEEKDEASPPTRRWYERGISLQTPPRLTMSTAYAHTPLFCHHCIETCTPFHLATSCVKHIYCCCLNWFVRYSLFIKTHSALPYCLILVMMHRGYLFAGAVLYADGLL